MNYIHHLFSFSVPWNFFPEQRAGDCSDIPPGTVLRFKVFKWVCVCIALFMALKTLNPIVITTGDGELHV